ncbi:MAG: lysophospholipase, partial [Planctomycetia bacterium]|nr:lysophospholipase [Planctomycetia bacterium]
MKPHVRAIEASSTILLLAACAVAAAAPPTAGEPASPRDLVLNAKRIVVLGDSITYGGGWLVPVIAWLEGEGWTGDVINMALSSETVSGLSEDGHADGKFPRPDLHERLDRVLRVGRPDLVIACYGMNCGIYQPLDEGRFAKFKDGMQRLHDAVEKAGARIIHLTPPVYDQRPDKDGPAGKTDYDAVLDAYSQWLVSRRADGWIVIDIHGPMKELLATARAKEPRTVFAPDAVHPNEAGHWAFARGFFKGLGAPGAAAKETPEHFAAFVPDVKRRMDVLRDAYLAAAGHQRPGVPSGQPLGEAEATARDLSESIRSRRYHLMGGRTGQ